MPRGGKGGRSACTRAEAVTRLAHAGALVTAAELLLSDEADPAMPGVAVANAALAGIAASDAACCARLGERPRGQAHAEAVRLVATVAPHGEELARDLERLLNRKDDAHYGTTFVTRADAERLVGYARRMVQTARRVLEA